MLPTGSVGIPAVTAIFAALAYRYAADHGLDVPRDAHFWCVLGDSEMREGSLLEALPEAAERHLGNVTWIVDFNRQSLDGPRPAGDGRPYRSDAERIAGTARANGWSVIEVRHGPRRRRLFGLPHGQRLQRLLEESFTDLEIQTLLYRRDGALIRQQLLEKDPGVGALLRKHDDATLVDVFSDLGGHDIGALVEALHQSKIDPTTPTLVLAHTVKGWGLSLAAAPGNHSAIPKADEVNALLEREGLTEGQPYAGFAPDSPEGQLLDHRGIDLRRGLEALWSERDRRLAAVSRRIDAAGGLPDDVGVDLGLHPLAHTQWMWGQLSSKLIRIGATAQFEQATGKAMRPLSDEDQRWQPAAELLLTMSPDVGTSTNLNPSIDEKVYGPGPAIDFETHFDARDRRRPSLTPTEAPWSRHIRFEIAEANCMTAVGAFGKMGSMCGVPLLPMMTIYDFFIKRALDQLYYNLYWDASFILVGTPSGVTLAPEGAQHSWKSDIQMPNLITWEPMFAVETDWILGDAVRRHFSGDNVGRRGVLLRAVTRALPQTELLTRLRRQRRFKAQPTEGTALLPDAYADDKDGVVESTLAALPDQEILAALRADTLAGGYHLIDYRGYAGYQPGENVVNIFAAGAMGSEALAASDRLLADGIYANVIAVTSADLLAGALAERGDYRHLRQHLGVRGDLHLVPGQTAGPVGNDVLQHADVVTLAGRRVPAVSVCDAEPGLLDNIGSVVGVRQIALGLTRASKSGTPAEVYGYHGIDAHAIRDACGRALAETALENVVVSGDVLRSPPAQPATPSTWRELWPRTGARS